MSHDATYILIEGDQQQFFYSRWGGLYLDLDLLQGPEYFHRHLSGLTHTSRPFFEAYLCGLVEMDYNRHRLRYWGSQGFGSDSVSRRMYQSLLAGQWAGWTLEWLSAPAKTMAAPLPHTHTIDLSIQEIQTWQTQPWAEAQETLPDFATLVASEGEDAVRSWFELDFTTWVTLRTEDGLRDEVIASGWPAGHTFLLGSDLLQILKVRPQRTLAQLEKTEKEIQACCLVDIPNRCFWWWQLKPQWSPIWDIERAWAGWQSQWLNQGPRQQLEITGRDPQALLSTYCIDELETWFSRLLGPRQSPSQILTTIAGSLTRRPEEKLSITSPGPGSEGIVPPDEWSQTITDNFRSLLKTPAFQPKIKPDSHSNRMGRAET